jgi:hypothetical protein
MIRLFALAAATSTLLACAPLDGFDMDDGWWDADYAMQNTAIQGRMAGDMPHVGTFEEAGATGTNWSSGDWVDLQLNANGDYGWAMVGLSGAVDPVTGEIDTNDAWVIGCSGPDSGIADFDEPASASNVQIDIIDVDGVEMQRVEVLADFEGGNTVLAIAEVPLGEAPFGE